MWGDHDGLVCLGHGTPYLDGDKYRHRDFRQVFGVWPDQAAWLADHALHQAAHGRDIYVTPMLRAERSRKKGTGAGGRWAWTDLDGPLTVERRAAIHAIGAAARVVSSGTGHHVYVELDDWYPLDVIEDTNRRLAAMLDGDHKWDDAAFLRLPGTFNLKPLIFHHRTPALVQVVTL
jgi:hypothetical protein